MSILLIGCGYWGRNWANTLFEAGELSAICEANTGIHSELAAAYPNVTLVSSLDEALALPSIEAAIVATPVFTHADTARRCLQNNWHVLVEKPLTDDATSAADLVALAAERGKTLAVGHICLFYPGWQRLKELMADGTLGDIRSITCTREKLGIVRNEEDVWWSFAPHDISLIADVLEGLLTVQSVASTYELGRPTIADHVTAVLTTEAGQTATIRVGWLTPNKRFETVVVGTKAIACLNHAGQPQTLTMQAITADSQGAIKYNTPATTETFEMASPLAIQLEAFLGAIRHGKPLPNTGTNGAQVVSVLADVAKHLSPKVLSPA
jgi:UDP-2-acetamido-3-amino-2,3-dideoxy-glucuronate N-acetyltransferase